MAASDNPLLNKTIENDPILFCTAFKRSRFYLFSKDEPETDGNHKGFDRDVFNEKPTREEQSLAAIQPAPSKGVRTASFAIMHTDKGDIHLRLFPEAAPKTVENFVVHSKNGYYDGLKFHRVIKKFMCARARTFLALVIDGRVQDTDGRPIWRRYRRGELHLLLLANWSEVVGRNRFGATHSRTSFHLQPSTTGRIR
jgi:hypothetical protein